MALPLGKLTILLGAGVIGSYLATEGRLPTASDLFSGAFKTVWKGLGKSDSSAPNPKPKNDVWLQQVNSLREEIQFYASRRPVTIVTSTSSGGRRYYIVVVILAVGGYLWWKGWKLPDLRFATRRSLSDARTDIEKKLQNVHSSISTTKHQVSLKLDGLDSKLDETHENSKAAHRDVSDLLREDVRLTDDRVKSVIQAVEYLETTVDRFEGKQGILFSGMRTLLNFVRGLEERRAVGQIKGGASSFSQRAIDLPQSPPRAGSMHGNLILEAASPSSPSTLNGSVQHELVSNGKKASSESSGHSSSVTDPSSGSGNGSSSGFSLFGGNSVGPSVVRRSHSLKLIFNI